MRKGAPFTTAAWPRSARWCLLLALVSQVGCDDRGALGDPSAAALQEPAPDSFLVAVGTSAGEFRVVFHRAWSPAGADRVFHLARHGFYEGARIYRVNDRYAQFGFSGDPVLDSTWTEWPIPDEPVRASNTRGAVSFARGGPDTRSFILFINRSDNTDLDDLEWRGVMGFPPVGRVTEGMEVVDELYDAYGEAPMQWEDSIALLGNDFFARQYPRLDSIAALRVLEEWR